MRFRVALTGLVWLLGLGSAAHAGEAGSGALFHKNQALASCTIANQTRAASLSQCKS
jgi:hypothetical protein